MKKAIKNTSQHAEMSLNSQNQLHGGAIASIGIFLFFVGLAIFIFGIFVESILLLLLGALIGIFIAGFFLLYPLIRLLFGGRDSIGVTIATVLVEGWITKKVSKKIKKQGNSL